MNARDEGFRASGDPLHTVAVNVGNTSARVGLIRDTEPVGSDRFPVKDVDAIVDAITTHAENVWGEARRAIVIASVNEPAAAPIIEAVREVYPTGVFILGDDLDVPIRTDVDPGYTPGQDRLLNALAAFHLRKQACVVVDAGTAITVDFVDGEGTFIGGAIAPGLRLSLDALHRGTAALPHVELAVPDADPFGRSTREAMLNGVLYGARGLVRMLTERYAEAYRAYPIVIATGGDARVLFEGDELIDAIVDDLTLRGIALACTHAMADADDE